LCCSVEGLVGLVVLQCGGAGWVGLVCCVAVRVGTLSKNRDYFNLLLFVVVCCCLLLLLVLLFVVVCCCLLLLVLLFVVVLVVLVIVVAVVGLLCCSGWVRCVAVVV